MCELARNSILQSGWELQIKKQWLGDDLEMVASCNVPPGRLAVRREMLAEEKRLMMLSTAKRSRANTAESWFSTEGSRPPSRNTPNGVMKGLASSILGMFQGERDGLEDVEERSEEGEVGKNGNEE
jgi:hypothetical protein